MRFFFTRKILFVWLGLLIWLVVERVTEIPGLGRASEVLNLAFLGWMFLQSRRIFQWSQDLSVRRRLSVLAQVGALLFITGVLLVVLITEPAGEGAAAEVEFTGRFPLPLALLEGLLVFLMGCAAVILASLVFYEAGTVRTIWTVAACGIMLVGGSVLPADQGWTWLIPLGIIISASTPWRDELGGRARIAVFFGGFLAILLAAVFQSRIRFGETEQVFLNTLRGHAGILTVGFLRAVLILFLSHALVFQAKTLFSPVTRLAAVRGGLRTKLFFFYVLAGAVPLILMILILSIGFYIVLGGYRASLGKRIVAESTESCAEWAESIAEDSRILQWASRRPVSVDSVSVDPALSELLTHILEGQDSDLQGRYVLVQVETASSRWVACSETTPEARWAGYPLPAWSANITRVGLVAEPDGVWSRAVAGRILKGATLVVEAGAPLDQTFLEEMKSLTGVDFELTNGYWMQVTVARRQISTSRAKMPEDIAPEWRSISTAPSAEAASGFLDRRLYFGGAFLSEIDWSTGETLEKVAGMLLVRTSIRNLYQVLFAPENTINLLLLVIVGILAGLFLVIILVASGVGIRVVHNITRSVGALKKGTQRVRAGDFDYRIHVTSRDEFEDLADSFNVMSAEIRRMLAAVKEKERLESELRIARSIQQRLLPQDSPELLGYEICGRSTSAREVGGDYFDYLMFGSASLGLAVGDVSGKGITAALLMANLQASLRAFAREPSGIAGVMEALNIQLHKTTSPEMYATFFYGILDSGNGVFSFANAGHNPPLLVRADGRIDLLDAGGLPLGMMEGFPYEEAKTDLAPGDVLVLYTDGVTEAEKADGEQLGDELFRDVVVSNRHLGARELQERIHETVREFTAGHDQSDDLTLITLKVLEKGDVETGEDG